MGRKGERDRERERESSPLEGRLRNPRHLRRCSPPPPLPPGYPSELCKLCPAP
ncbi:unnamed protein product [Spirodela intermedia]|uniref:Uncharacterized protein n=1 Tax=Spirodela intermedia TaxID=51605 RepID=A0A7I8KM94_SPIIN|nr:unnamed protein product [Spirodela intermedia]